MTSLYIREIHSALNLDNMEHHIERTYGLSYNYHYSYQNGEYKLIENFREYIPTNIFLRLNNLKNIVHFAISHKLHYYH